MKPMKFVLGAMALGCLATGAWAQSPYSGAPRTLGAGPGALMTAQAPAVAPENVAPYGGGPSPGGGCNSGCCGGGDGLLGLGGLRLVGGGGAYYIQPRFETDPGFSFDSRPFGNITVPGTQLTIVRDANFPNLDANLTFAYDYEIAPRFWVGVTDECGCGGRFRYWGLDQDATKFVSLGNMVVGTIPNGTAAPIPFTFTEDSFAVAQGSVEFKVYDFELTYESNCCGWWLVSCGVRYLELEQDYNAFLRANLLATANGATSTSLAQVETVNVGDRFQGLGPTVSLETRLPTGCFNIAFYASGRLSLLVGHGETAAFRTLDRTEFVAPSSTLNFSAAGGAVADRDDIIGIGEAEVGIECGHELGGASVFGRIALVAQTWRDVQIPSDGIVPLNSFGGFATMGMRNRDKTETDLNLFGVTAVVGFKF